MADQKKTNKTIPARKENRLNPASEIQGFTTFIRDQGVLGLAIGFVLGGAVSKAVSSLVSDIINPLLSIFLGATENLSKATLSVGGVDIFWGRFLSSLMDFIVIALVVYYAVRLLRLSKDEVEKQKKIKL